MTTEPLIVGAVLRRTVRTALDAAAIPYRERKGLLDSTFVVSVTPAQRAAISRWMDSVNAA